jgi:hypothetical protein
VKKSDIERPDRKYYVTFIAEVHVAIRSDLDRNSTAYLLYEWLQTDNLKPMFEECGFIPK